MTGVVRHLYTCGRGPVRWAGRREIGNAVCQISKQNDNYGYILIQHHPESRRKVMGSIAVILMKGGGTF